METGKRRDPYLGYKFLVEMGTMGGQKEVIAGVTEVSGLGIQIEVERKMFGGENDIEYTFIKGTKYPDLTLKRGLIDSSMWDWYYNVIHGKIERKNGSIKLCDHAGETLVCWDFINAIPIKWDGPVLNATSSAVAIESLVLAHQGLTRTMDDRGV